MAVEATEAGQQLLDLAWKYVFSAHDQHVIGPTLDPKEASIRAATCTGLRGEHSSIPRAVPHHRRGLSTEARQHQLTWLAFLKWRPGVRVHNFRVEVILEDVQAIVPAAFGCHSGPTQLRQTINVEGFQVEARFDLTPHAIAPGLRPEDAHSQSRVQMTSGRVKSFGQNQRV